MPLWRPPRVLPCGGPQPAGDAGVTVDQSAVRSSRRHDSGAYQPGIPRCPALCHGRHDSHAGTWRMGGAPCRCSCPAALAAGLPTASRYLPSGDCSLALVGPRWPGTSAYAPQALPTRVCCRTCSASRPVLECPARLARVHRFTLHCTSHASKPWTGLRRRWHCALLG